MIVHTVKISGLMTQDIITDLIKDGVFEDLKDLGDASEVKKFSLFVVCHSMLFHCVAGPISGVL